MGVSTYYKYQRLTRRVTFLKKVPAFSSLPEARILSAAEALEEETHCAGETIILEGEKGDHFYLIEEGTVRYKVSKQENENETKDEEGPGGWFGERALLDENSKRKASVVALTDVRLLCMERSLFRQLVNGNEQQLLRQKESLLREATQVGEKYRKTIKLSDLKIFRTLGEGAFGRVRLVKHRITNHMYALKYLGKQSIVENASQEHVMNELTIMMMVDSPFILRLYNSFQDRRYLYFLVELVRGGELFTLLRDRGCLPDKTTRFYAAGAIEAFGHLHGLSVTYRDLKPENLLITRGGYIKLIDLGLAKVVTERTFTLCGTPEYFAPEAIVNMGHDRAVDYWALGILIFEMTTGSVPFEGGDSMSTYQLILKGQIVFPEKFPPACQKIVTLFCQKKPQRRLGYLNIDDVKRHHWFTGFDWQSFTALKMDSPYKPNVKHDEDVSNFDKYEEISHTAFPQCSWQLEGFAQAE